MTDRELRKKKQEEEQREVMRTLTFITQFGINMLVPIFLCFFIGRVLDGKLETSYWTVLLFFLGAAAGIRNVYLLVKKKLINPAHEDIFQEEKEVSQEEDADEEWS